MNVPPVAATHTEWRTCGPQRGYSLPICFHDSDNELSTRGTQISDKVQMIIESLRSSQSSLEMGDEMEGKVLSGQEGHPQGCKVAVGSYVGVKSNTKGPTENQLAGVSSPIDLKSSDSDSDDSVDRGIEEAILEYLKEKDDHKRKAEPCFNFLQSSKIPRKTPLIPEVSQQNPDSNLCLPVATQFPINVKTENPTAPAVRKKHTKNKEFLNDSIVRKLDLNRSTTAKSFVLPKDQTKSPSKTISLLSKIKCPVTVKTEEDSNDSSSDDGIEEAIQRYQLEKKEQENKREAFNLFEEDSDSTSDDGIEEAIRSYQLEQLKEKSVLNPFLHKQRPFSKSLMHAVEGASVENINKHKLRKKKARTEKEVKFDQPPPSSVFIPKNTPADGLTGKGNGLLLLKVENIKEQPIPTSAPPKVNTTAELMCAEAILDISKTVMPEAFHHSVGLSSCTPTGSSLQSSLPVNRPAVESDGSSVDSEDGIEQEIRKFLEQKAQMHKPSSSSATAQETQSVNEVEEVKKTAVTPKKPARLSLTQKRRQREESSSLSNMSGTDNNVMAPAISPEQGKESIPSLISHRRQVHSIPRLHQTAQSGDKSSSLDSDEDLDTAIKDLLKTKKKSKKKTRDLKRKSRKHLKDDEPMLGNALPSKKFKPDAISKRGALKKVKKSKDDTKAKSGSTKVSVSQQKQTKKADEYGTHQGETEKLKATQGQEALSLPDTQAAPQIKEDSSSVDSDDSIEQEIRRFLAEKAKVSTAEKGTGMGGDNSRNGTATLCTQHRAEDIEQENQLAEIPRKNNSPLSGQSPYSRQPLLLPQSLQPVTSAVGVQSCLTSEQPSSPSLLEPADGAGAARTVQRPNPGRVDVQNVATQMERVRPVLSPKVANSRSEVIKWRQSLGLITTETRTLSRTPFQITSSKISEAGSATSPFPNRVITPRSQAPVTGWSSVKTSRASFPCPAGTTVNATFRSPVSNLASAARPHPRMPLTQSLGLGHRSQCRVEGETESMVHMLKDKSVFVELESNRTNHVQVRSRERSEEKGRVVLLSEMKRESESKKIDDKEVHLDRTEEEFIDEADCESGNRRDEEKMQGLSSL